MAIASGPSPATPNPKSKLGLWILDLVFESWILDFGFWSWILGFGCWFWDFGFRVSDFGFWILEFGFWFLDFEFGVLDFGSWILDFGIWILDIWIWIGCHRLDFAYDSSTSHADSGRRTTRVYEYIQLQHKMICKSVMLKSCMFARKHTYRLLVGDHFSLKK